MDALPAKRPVENGKTPVHGKQNESKYHNHKSEGGLKMKKTKGFAKFVTMMMLAVSIALGTVPVQVHAADPIPKESFDYVYYANANPDRRAVALY